LRENRVWLKMGWNHNHFILAMSFAFFSSICFSRQKRAEVTDSSSFSFLGRDISIDNMTDLEGVTDGDISIDDCDVMNLSW